MSKNHQNVVARLRKKTISREERINKIMEGKIKKELRDTFEYNDVNKSIIGDIKACMFEDIFINKYPFIIIGENYNHIEKIYGLKTMLYKHQQTAVAAMLDLERERIIYNNKLQELTYNSAVLSEPVGSGKTIDILSIIIINKIPRAIPDIKKANGILIRTKYSKLIKATLIFVSSSVLNQWELAIQKFTYLKYFVIKSVLEIRKLFSLILSKKVNDYDIILIKNGVVTVPLEFPDDIIVFEKNKTNHKYIYDIISNLYNHCWARVVLDDFDNIKIPTKASKINALFTWYVSSTKTSLKSDIPNYKDNISYLRESPNVYINIIKDKIGFCLLNIRNNKKFINEHNKMPYIKFHVVMFVNVNDNVINMIDVMGNTNITEMLNGDAVQEAAIKIGINATSIIDIFEKILGNNYTNFIMASKIMAFIECQEAQSDKWIPMRDNPNPEDTYYGYERLNNFEEIKYKYPNIDNFLREAYLRQTVIKEQAGLSIQRVKDNIKHGECPICMRSLAEVDDYIIVKCCNNILCRECGIKAQIVNGKITRCSNCRAALTVNDLVFVGEKLELNKIINEEFDDSEPADDSDVSDENSKEINDKFEAVISIVNGEKIKNDVRVELNLPNVMKGSNYMPENDIRKVLIFANFKESIEKMSNKLTNNNIKFWKLGGTAKEIHELAEQFTNCKTKCALLIEATKYCSGLNLQTSTDLVFLHRMHNVEMECQVIGRGQRIGRTSPLNIWYILFENELTKLIDSHGIRKLAMEEINNESNYGAEKVTDDNETSENYEIESGDEFCDVGTKKKILSLRTNFDKQNVKAPIKDGKVQTINQNMAAEASDSEYSLSDGDYDNESEVHDNESEVHENNKERVITIDDYENGSDYDDRSDISD